MEERKKPPDKQNNNMSKSSLQRGLLLVMLSGSVTYMGASGFVTTSTKQSMESIWKNHHTLVNIYIANINSNCKYIIKQVSEDLPSGLFITTTELIRIRTDTGWSDSVSGFKQDFLTVISWSWRLVVSSKGFQSHTKLLTNVFLR